MKKVHVQDPIDLEIKWQRLIAIMDEIDNATIKTAFSTIVSDSHDFACILLDSSGNSICQSSFSPPDFCVIIPSTARKIIKETSVDIKYYSVIYETIEDITNMISGMASPIIKEEICGLAEVKDVFDSPSLGKIAGCLVIEGRVIRSNPIRVLRDNTVIYEGELESLRRFKDDVKEVKSGTECGIGIKNYNDVKVSDQIECYRIVESK